MNTLPKLKISDKSENLDHSVQLLGWVCGLHDALILHKDEYELKIAHFRSIRSFVYDTYNEQCRKEFFVHISQLEDRDIYELFLVPLDIFPVALLRAFTRVRLSEVRYQRHPSHLSPITEFREFPKGIMYVRGAKIP